LTSKTEIAPLLPVFLMDDAFCQLQERIIEFQPLGLE
jgi:hypothetical protein